LPKADLRPGFLLDYPWSFGGNEAVLRQTLNPAAYTKFE
jgi:hypothetical protein